MPIRQTNLVTVHVSTQETWHGGEGQALHLMSELRRRGHRALLLARHGGQFARRAADHGFEVYTFRGRGRGPDSLWRIRGILKDIKPDVIHSHDGHALTASGLASLGLHVPVRVASRRVDFAIRSAAKFNHLADVVIAISAAVADVCRAAGVPEGRIRIVHSGVDPARVAQGDRTRGRESLGVEDEPVILVVANLTDHKGHVYLLDAVPKVLRECPNARLALAGDGELRESLLAHAAELGIADRVDCLGYRNDIPDLLQAADLFVMPSHMEGLCTSLIDAMFARRPIVTTAAGGIAEVIGSASSDVPVTFTAAPRDPDSLASAIVRALSSPSETANLVDRASERAHRMFTHERMAEGTLAVYEEMLAQKRERAA